MGKWLQNTQYLEYSAKKKKHYGPKNMPKGKKNDKKYFGGAFYFSLLALSKHLATEFWAKKNAGKSARKLCDITLKNY